MPRYSTVKIFPYAQKDLYRLVADIESYPLFLPGCAYARIMRREGEELWADMSVEGLFFKSRYTSHVICSPDHRIDATLDHGSLKHPHIQALQTCWTFHALDVQSTEIGFDLEISCHAFWKNHLLDQNISRLGSAMVQAFQDQAHHLLAGCASKGNRGDAP